MEYSCLITLITILIMSFLSDKLIEKINGPLCAHAIAEFCTLYKAFIIELK